MKRSKRNGIKSGISRRTFVQIAAAGSVALGLPRFIRAAAPTTPSDKILRVACIGGGGGKGHDDMEQMKAHSSVRIAAICDVDSGRLDATITKLPGAKGYTDYREMLAKEKDNIDAVTISTPDHMHAPCTVSAMNLGKHVYCQKPLTHDMYETRQMMLIARKQGIVSQMGIQHHSMLPNRQAIQMIQEGVIGKVKEMHVWTNRPIWPQGENFPTKADPVPQNLNWDLWLGTAPQRDYINDAFHPFKWRGWTDFGTGAIGDMGCHMIDPVKSALNLGAPIAATMEGGAITQRYPGAEIIHYEFAGTQYSAGSTLKLTWYDGGNKPNEMILDWCKDELERFKKDEEAANARAKAAEAERAKNPEHDKKKDHKPKKDDEDRPKGKTVEERFLNQKWLKTLTAFVGEKGVLLLPENGGAQLTPRGAFTEYKRPNPGSVNHYHQWVDACLGKGTTTCGFDYAAPLNETVLLGTLSSRFPNQRLEWDSDGFKISNFGPANAFLRRTYRKGWEVEGLS